jgi:hypothetical protein
MKIAIAAGVNLVVSLIMLKGFILTWRNGGSFLNLQRLSDFFSTERPFVWSEIPLNLFVLAIALIPILNLITTAGSSAILIARYAGRSAKLGMWTIILSVLVLWQALILLSFSYT